MTTLTAGLIAAATITAVYFFCIRPMRRGNCMSAHDTAADVQVDQQVAALREELRVLRAQDTLDRGGLHRAAGIPHHVDMAEKGQT